MNIVEGGEEIRNIKGGDRRERKDFFFLVVVPTFKIAMGTASSEITEQRIIRNNYKDKGIVSKK